MAAMRAETTGEEFDSRQRSKGADEPFYSYRYLVLLSSIFVNHTTEILIVAPPEKYLQNLRT